MRKQPGQKLTLIAFFCAFLVMHTGISSASEIPKGIITLDGQTAPALVLKDLDGQAYDLSSSTGHWVFLHFWASWCGPCRKEMPTIEAIAPEFEDSSLKIVLVNTAESEDTIFGFLAEFAPGLNSLLDSDGTVTEQWQPRGLPATFLIDPDGKLRYMALGGRPWNSAPYLDFLKGLTASITP